MSQEPLNYGRSTPPAPRGTGVQSFFRISAILIVVLTGLRFYGYLISFVFLIVSEALFREAGGARDVFRECISAATPFALGGILFLVNEIAHRRRR